MAVISGDKQIEIISSLSRKNSIYLVSTHYLDSENHKMFDNSGVITSLSLKKALNWAIWK